MADSHFLHMEVIPQIVWPVDFKLVESRGQEGTKNNKGERGICRNMHISRTKHLKECFL